jgi:hypothetical protein
LAHYRRSTPTLDIAKSFLAHHLDIAPGPIEHDYPGRSIDCRTGARGRTCRAVRDEKVEETAKR